MSSEQLSEILADFCDCTIWKVLDSHFIVDCTHLYEGIKVPEIIEYLKDTGFSASPNINTFE